MDQNTDAGHSGRLEDSPYRYLPRYFQRFLSYSSTIRLVKIRKNDLGNPAGARDCLTGCSSFLGISILVFAFTIVSTLIVDSTRMHYFNFSNSLEDIYGRLSSTLVWDPLGSATLFVSTLLLQTSWVLFIGTKKPKYKLTLENRFWVLPMMGSAAFFFYSLQANFDLDKIAYGVAVLLLSTVYFYALSWTELKRK